VVLSHLSDLADVALPVHLTYASQCSTVTNVNDINIVVDYKKHQGATARFVCDLPILVECYLLKKVVFSLFCTLSNRSLDIVRELWLHYNVVVKVIF